MPISASTFGLPKNFSRILVGAAALSLGACAVSAPLTIESTGDQVGLRDIAIAFPKPDPADAPIRRDFATALAQALSTQNVAVSDSGDLLADFAIANGIAGTGVQVTPGPETVETQWISAPRPRKRFDECDARVLRGTLVLIDREGGGIVYNGKAAMTECEFGNADIDAVAQALVADLVSTLR